MTSKVANVILLSKIHDNMPKEESQELLEVLQGFGFTLLQAKVYLSLLELGPTTAGPLVRKSGLHRQLVYSALELLEADKFVSHTIKNNRKVFSAARPEILLEKESERMRKVQLSIPKLQNLIPKGSPNFHVEVMRGNEEFRRRLFTLVDSAKRTDGIIRIIADVRDVDVYSAVGPAYQEYKKHTTENKVKKRLIAPHGSITKAYQERFTKEIGSELRISAFANPMPTSICLTSEVVVFDLFSEEVVSLMIWNQTIAKSFKAHFDSLWKAAIPYKNYLKEVERGI